MWLLEGRRKYVVFGKERKINKLSWPAITVMGKRGFFVDGYTAYAGGDSMYFVKGRVDEAFTLRNVGGIKRFIYKSGPFDYLASVYGVSKSTIRRVIKYSNSVELMPVFGGAGLVMAVISKKGKKSVYFFDKRIRFVKGNRVLVYGDSSAIGYILRGREPDVDPVGEYYLERRGFRAADFSYVMNDAIYAAKDNVLLSFRGGNYYVEYPFSKGISFATFYALLEVGEEFFEIF